MLQVLIINKMIANTALVSESSINEKTSLVLDLHMDSMMFTALLCELESEFCVIISDEEAQSLYLVGDIYFLITKKLVR